MRPVFLSIFLLVMIQITYNRRLTRNAIKNLEKKVSKFLTDPHDVVHMKVSFNKMNKKKNVLSKSRSKSLRIRSPLDEVNHRYLKMIKKSNYVQPRNKSAIVEKYNFFNKRIKTKRPRRSLLKAKTSRKKPSKNQKKRKLQIDLDSKEAVWLKDTIKRTAQALDIRTTTDAILAGAGTASLIYGVHHKKKTLKKRSTATRVLQREYLYKKSYDEQLGIEVKNLKLIYEQLDDCQNKIVTTQESIVTCIDNRMAYGADSDL